ncbi:MAG TPA: hypothetical protein DCY13_15245 [Verrucomicrobiales bacterium]|nr:hypothetical protein [Verrucomicrobiales bacterium]
MPPGIVNGEFDRRLHLGATDEKLPPNIANRMQGLDDFQVVVERGPGLHTLSVPLVTMGANFGRRLVIVRGRDGCLALLSPVGLTPDLHRQVSALGEIRLLIVPTDFHDGGVAAARRQMEGAALLVSDGLMKLPGAMPLPTSLPGELAAELLSIPIGGQPSVNETVFLHSATGLLLVSDLIFNFDHRWRGWSRLLFRIAGAYGGPKVSRLFRSCIRDRAAFRESINAIPWSKVTGIVPSHGDCLFSATERVERMLKAI